MSGLFCLDPAPQAAPAVLLLHGLGADSSSWALQIPALVEAGFRPLAVDAPGFGRSPYDGRGWSFRRAASALARLLDEKGVPSAHVVGLSMGGVLAQQFALDHPTRVERLVLVSTFARLRAGLSGLWYFLSRAVLVHTVGLPKQAELVARRVFPAPEQDALRAELVRVISQADPRAYRGAMRALGTFNSTPRLKELRAPTLVVTGAADTTVPPHVQRELALSIAGARQVILDGAGHAVSVDAAAEFNRLVVEFLSRQP